MSTFWAEPSLQVEAAEKGKEVKEKRKESRDMRGEEETTHKFVVNERCFGPDRAFPQKQKELRYLNVGAWEDAHPAVVLSFIPVLVDLLINVNNVSLLQRKLPVNRRACILADVSICVRLRHPVF